MTDQNVNVNAGQDDDDEGLFDPASDSFPRRNDLRDRLVVIYPTGKHGTRQGEGADAKPYPWYECTVVVLDDGPEGWQPTVPDDDGDPTENRVASVEDEGPQVLRNFQWSAGGIVAKMQQKTPGCIPAHPGRPGSILGRINTKKNKIKGRSAPWNIAPPTEAERELAQQYADVCRAARAAIESDQGGDDF